MRHAAAVLTAILGIQLCGCEGESSTPGPPPKPAPTPQERFDRVVDTVKELLEGGVSSRDPRGSVSGVYTVEASPSIADPEEEGKPLRAFIRVSLKTKYFANLSDDEEKAEEKEPQGEGRSDRRNSFTEGMDTLDGPEAEILDDGLIPEMPRGSGRGNTDLLQMVPSLRTTEADDQAVYHLEFVRDRWRLASPPQDGALTSMNEAIKIALKRQ